MGEVGVEGTPEAAEEECSLGQRIQTSHDVELVLLLCRVSLQLS